MDLLKRETEVILFGNYHFIDLQYSTENEAWVLTFSDTLTIRLTCFWRLLSPKGIIWISTDHNQIYGLNSPIDLVAQLKEILSNSLLTRIERGTLTGDLFLEVNNKYLLEAFTDSSGWESWEIVLGDKIHIGMGQGKIARFG